jgi:hypothetical protein
MRARTTLTTIAIAALAAIPSGSALEASQRATAEARATAVAGTFLRTINTRRFERTCGLLSTGFYRANHVPSKARCVLTLRIGFTWAPTYRFRIVAVRLDGDRAVIETLANGAPGRPRPPGSPSSSPQSRPGSSSLWGEEARRTTSSSRTGRS